MYIDKIYAYRLKKSLVTPSSISSRLSLLTFELLSACVKPSSSSPLHCVDPCFGLSPGWQPLEITQLFFPALWKYFALEERN